MQHTNGKAAALVCGFVATACALAILLQDAIRTGVWTIEHGLIPGLILVQILTGHLFVAALYGRRMLPALGFLIVATVSTYGVLATSVEKQSAIQAEATAKAEDVNGRRQSIERSIADAEAMLSPCPAGSPKDFFGNRCGLRAAMAAECGTGQGGKCKGKTASVTLYEAALKTHRTELAEIGPAHKVGAKSENMATLIAAMTGRDKAKTQQVLEIIRPFTFALIFELAALVSFGFAFRHGPRVVTANDNIQTSFATPEPLPPATQLPPTDRTLPTLKGETVVDWSKRYHARHGVWPPLNEIEAAFADQIAAGQFSRSTAYRRVKALKAA